MIGVVLVMNIILLRGIIGNKGNFECLILCAGVSISLCAYFMNKIK